MTAFQRLLAEPCASTPIRNLTGALSFIKEGREASAESLPAQKELYYPGLWVRFVWAAGGGMRRAYRLMTSGAVLALWPLAAPGMDPQLAHDVAVCASAAGAFVADDRIAACTRAINSGEWCG